MYAHNPYNEKIRKVTAKTLGLKKHDMEISTAERYKFHKKAVKFEIGYAKELLKYLNKEGNSPGTFQEYVVKEGRTKEDDVMEYDPMTASRDFPQSDILYKKLGMQLENVDINEFGSIDFIAAQDLRPHVTRL